jgi:hypothetical protein
MAPSSKSLLDSLGDFFFGEDEAARPAPTAAGKSASINAKSPIATGKIPAGTMQLIGLQNVREILGARWPQRIEHIHSLIEAIFRRRLDPADVHYKVDDENYLILFTRLGRQEAAFKAKVIADEIQKLVAGDMPEQQDLIVTSNVTDVDRSLVIEKIDSLKDLVEYVRSHTAPANKESGVTFFDDSGAPQADELKPHAAVGAGPDLADLDQSLVGLFQKKTTATFLKECRAGFYPAYSLRRRGFTAFDAVAIHTPSNQSADQVNDPFLDRPEELPFYLDRYILTTGLLGLHRMLTGGHRGVVMISVSFDTLAMSKLRDIYFARLKEVPGGLTKFIGIIVRNIPVGTPASRIAEVMAYIQPFCGTRILRIAPDFKLIDLYANSGGHGFATWLPADEQDGGKTFQTMSTFAKRAALHRQECIITDLETSDDVSTAIAVGCTYVTGPAVAPLIYTPGVVEGLTATHILRHAGFS